jgi:REP element-mobilizing transposase RayT/CheY-like chemotaxis protein
MSPDRAFAELLRSSLEESGHYSVHPAYNAREALAAAEAGGFDLAILDADIEDEPVSAAGQRLMALDPDMLLMVIPPDDDPQHFSLVNFTPHSYINRPFYLPDLLERLDTLLGMGEAAMAVETQDSENLLEENYLSKWLQDGQQVSYDLELLLRETYFTAMVVVDGGHAAGFSIHFDPQDARDLAERVGQDWDQRSDLARYIRLHEQGGEYLLYAALLTGKVCLAVVSDVSLPLSQVRSRTRALAKMLLQMVDQRGIEAHEQQRLDAAILSRVDEVLAPVDQTELAGLVLPKVEPTALASEGGEDEDLNDDGPLINLTDLLAEMPPPDPPFAFSKSEWEAAAPDDTAVSLPELQTKMQPPEAPEEIPPQDGLPDLVLPWEEAGGDAWAFTPPQSPEPISDTHPAPVISGKNNGSELTTPVFAQISFTCILIPARTDHRLVGDLAKSLHQWLPQACLGFGWHLQGVRVQPDYMMWTVSVTPTVSPGNIVRMVRNRASEQIFAQFPDLHEKNMAGDFWAPGYLVISGSQPPTEQLVGDFIHQTRRRQGIYL